MTYADWQEAWINATADDLAAFRWLMVASFVLVICALLAVQRTFGK